MIDSSLDSWWEKVTQKYAAKQIGDNKLPDKIAKLNENIIHDAEVKFQKAWKNLGKRQRPKLVDTLSYIEDHVPNTGIESKIRGMGVLKKLLVFGTVYRFLSPVAVTPLASMIGNWMISSSKNKEKAAQAEKTEQDNKTVKTAA